VDDKSYITTIVTVEPVEMMPQFATFATSEEDLSPDTPIQNSPGSIQENPPLNSGNLSPPDTQNCFKVRHFQEVQNSAHL